MSIEIATPMLPESVSEATVLAWHKEIGEPFKRDELLIELETEKIVLEVPAPADGVLSEIRKASGETVCEGDILGVVANSAAAAAPEPGKPEESEPPAGAEAQTAEPSAESTQPESAAAANPSPAARRIADESGIDISTVAGTGKGGRITKADMQKAVDAIQATAEPAAPLKPKQEPAPSVAPSAPVTASVSGQRAVTRRPMSRLRRTIADRLVQAQHTAALLTTFNEVDLSAVIALRASYRDDFESKHGARLGFMSFFVKAAVEALKGNPAVNAIIDGNDMVYHDYFDIGIAVSSPRGLVVPILRDAQLLSFADIEKNIRDFGSRAKTGALTLDELTGGTFTITNGGVFGSLVSTPIVNPPQSAILGMHKIQQRPVAENGEVVIRPMMYLALTYDHRIIDGREAVTFLVSIKSSLEDPARLLLEV